MLLHNLVNFNNFQGIPINFSESTMAISLTHHF